MNKERIIAVKTDLKQLKRLSKSIEVVIATRERQVSRLKTLAAIAQTEEVKANIRAVQKILNGLNIEELWHEQLELVKKYNAAVNNLEPIDKAIIVECFLNGKPYWKVGQTVGYTERGVQQRVDNALRQIADFMA